ncbi:MAG: sulfatase [Bacteroidota bacterium]
MMVRNSHVLLIILAAVILVSCIQEPGKRNVLFIIADDLNDNLGAYDHYLVKTPNIDRLARRGMLFNQAFCNFPLCGPSRASMMTGLYPDQTGHHRLRDFIRDHVPHVITMSQAFINAGYESSRVGKIYHYDNPRGIGTPGHDDSLSWNQRFYPRGVDKELEDQIFSLRPGSFGAVLSWLATEEEGEQHTDGLVATKAIELLSSYKENNTPFFLGVGFYKPHTPYVAPKEYFEMYNKADIVIPTVPENYLSTLPEPAAKNLTRFDHQNNLSDSLKRSAIHAYYATISFLDSQVGRVIDALDSLGLADNTIVVFTSDHGYHMGEHDYFQKLTLFENSGRIPLIIYNPRMENKGGRTDAFAEMIDLYPTLCELANVPAPEYIAGESLVPILKDPLKTVRESILTQVNTDYTVRTTKYRYTRWGEGGPGMFEFYDREKDPEELMNLADDSTYSVLISQMSDLLDQRIQMSRIPPLGLEVLDSN